MVLRESDLLKLKLFWRSLLGELTDVGREVRVSPRAVIHIHANTLAVDLQFREWAQEAVY